MQKMRCNSNDADCTVLFAVSGSNHYNERVPSTHKIYEYIIRFGVIIRDKSTLIGCNFHSRVVEYIMRRCMFFTGAVVWRRKTCKKSSFSRFWNCCVKTQTKIIPCPRRKSPSPFLKWGFLLTAEQSARTFSY